jgi:hypothetical protein
MSSESATNAFIVKWQTGIATLITNALSAQADFDNKNINKNGDTCPSRLVFPHSYFYV